MRNLTDEEWEDLQKDLTEIFKKHNVDMSVRSDVVFLKNEEDGKDKQFEVKT